MNTENEDDIDIVETPAEGEVIETEEQQETDAPVEDERLAEAEGDETETAEQKNQRRQRRRQRQKQAKDATLAELQQLRDIVPHLVNRITALEGHAVGSEEQNIEGLIGQRRNIVQQAEDAIRQGTDEGNGELVAKGLRLRDLANDEIRALEARKDQIATARKQPDNAPDPAIVNHASKWLRENSDWYDPQMGNEESKRAKQIDQSLVQEGYNPATPAYWNELTRRCEAELFEPAEQTPPRRRAPPQGTTREHNPNPGRRQISLSADRVAAIKELGDWDDPVKRKEWALYYENYDRQQARA